MQMTRILRREGADPNISGLLFKAVVQAVLIFWGRDVGPDPPDGAVPGKLSAQGCATAPREAYEAKGGGVMGISSSGGSDGGSGLRGDWDLHHKEAEYSRAIYCNATDSGPL